MNKEIIFDLNDLPLVIQELMLYLSDYKIFTFSGPLGAGKTTLIKALLKAAGVQGDVVSPTFAYLNIYNIGGDRQLCHFDLYRLSSVVEFLEQGFDEYLHDACSWCFIEWPEIIQPLLNNERVCSITLDYYGDKRKLIINFS